MLADNKRVRSQSRYYGNIIGEATALVESVAANNHFSLRKQLRYLCGGRRFPQNQLF